MTGKHARPAARRPKRGSQSALATDSPGLPVKPQRRRRLAVLLGSLGLLVAAFFWMGGLTRLSNRFAETAIAQRNLAAAEAWLEVSERLSAHDPARFFLAARVARRRQDLERMSANLDLALRYGFDPQRVHRERLLALAQSGRLEGIEPEINRWLSAGDSELPEISEAYANGLAMQARLDAAQQVLQAWHQDFPDDPAPLYSMGRLQEHSGQHNRAKESYRAAIALDDQCLPAHYSLGRLLLEDRDPKAAIAYFERCLAVPNPAAARIGVARCLIEMGETQRATELLYDVMEQDSEAILASYQLFGETPERFVAAGELGKLQANAGNYQEAKQLLDLAIAENPRDLPARYSRAIALRGLGKRDEAEAEFEYVRDVRKKLQQAGGLRERIAANPRDIEARLALGRLLLTYQSEVSGLFWIRSVLLYDAENVQAHQELANYYESHAAASPRDARLAREHRQLASAGKTD